MSKDMGVAYTRGRLTRASTVHVAKSLNVLSVYELINEIDSNKLKLLFGVAHLLNDFYVINVVIIIC